jgi:hypothetical protein
VIPLGHIAGIPVEETALSFGPVLLASGGVLSLKARERWGRLRRRRRDKREALAFSIATSAEASTRIGRDESNRRQ